MSIRVGDSKEKARELLDDIYKKLVSGLDLDVNEIKSMVYLADFAGKGFYVVETYDNSPISVGRRTRLLSTIVKMHDSYWKVDWNQGIVGDTFPNQPKEVLPVKRVSPEHEYVEWIPIWRVPVVHIQTVLGH